MNDSQAFSPQQSDNDNDCSTEAPFGERSTNSAEVLSPLVERHGDIQYSTVVRHGERNGLSFVPLPLNGLAMGSVASG